MSHANDNQSRVDAIAECMKRLKSRHNRAQWAVQDAGNPRVHEQLQYWFQDRYQYLQTEYATAINEAENIIGKQWLYDHRPMLNVFTAAVIFQPEKEQHDG